MKKKALNYIFLSLAFFSLFFFQKAFAITVNVCEDLVPATPPSDCYVNASHSSVTANGGYGYYTGIYPDTSTPLTVILTPTTFSSFSVQEGVSPNNNYWFIARNVSGVDYWYQIYNNGTGNVSFNPLTAELSSTTRIHQIINPVNNSTTILSTVSFQFEYYATGADGAAAITSGLEASTASVVVASEVVSDTRPSPSVNGTSTVGTSSVFSDAATSETRAESIAGSVTSETSISFAAVMCITPSLLFHESTFTPTEKPSRKPVLASTSASSPADVLAT